MTQNIYDNDVFFEGYKSLRGKDDNYNDLLEQPAMADLLPNLTDKVVLDLGCGYGHNCLDFTNRGAKRVIGIDLSEKMLEIARAESSHENIEYLCMDIADLGSIQQKFDLIYSSLVFHYIEDFEKLSTDIFNRLNVGGQLIFSQEHPIITATIDGKGHFNKGEEGNRVSYTFSNYNQSGQRNISWFIEGVVKYHRPMGEIVTTLAKTGFAIEELVEPIPNEWAIKKLPTITKEYIKPNFMLVKASKRG